MILNLNNINVEQAQKSSEKFVIIPVNDWIELMAQKQQEAAVKKVTRPTTPKVKTPAAKPAKVAKPAPKTVAKPTTVKPIVKKALAKKSGGTSIDDLTF